MFYEEEKELHAKFQKIKDDFFESFEEKMPVFNKGMWYLYILKLEYDFMYVGITNNPRKRIRKHFFGNGANITQKFMPLEVLDIIECRPLREDVEQVENDVTEYLFNAYGKDKVFGGGYCNIKK
jgi:predicted GIY-YIG superfamily endonuclease